MLIGEFEYDGIKCIARKCRSGDLHIIVVDKPEAVTRHHVAAVLKMIEAKEIEKGPVARCVPALD